MTEGFTIAQLKELLDIHENTIIKIFTNRIENLKSKITSVPEEHKQLKGEVKALQESVEFQNETYENIKKDMTEEKQKLETDNRNNEEVQQLIQQNTEMKEQITELKDRCRRNNLRFMGMKKKSGVESETWEESKAKVKVFLQEKLGLETDEITIERAHSVGKKEEGERRTIIAKFLNYKQREIVLNEYKELKLWEDQIYINQDFSEYTVEKRRFLSKRAKKTTETGEFAKVVYNRLVSY